MRSMSARPSSTPPVGLMTTPAGAWSAASATASFARQAASRRSNIATISSRVITPPEGWSGAIIARPSGFPLSRRASCPYHPAESAMRILLLSMPDSFEHTSVITTRMPNGALASLAGNVDPHHDIAIADLILVHGRVRATVERLVDTLQPEVVGLSVMTFQRRTAQRV